MDKPNGCKWIPKRPAYDDGQPPIFHSYDTRDHPFRCFDADFAAMSKPPILLSSCSSAIAFLLLHNFILQKSLYSSPEPSLPRRSRSMVLSPQVARLWLRSRLSIEDNEFPETLLTVSWWQPVPMRLLPLTFTSKQLNYQLHCGPSVAHYIATVCWRRAPVKRPSECQIAQACGPYQLVYLRTSNVRSAIDLRSCLRQYPLYHQFCIFSIFPFCQDTWEVLVNCKSVDEFKGCAEACGCVIEEDYHPAMPIEPSSGSVDRFDLHMRAQERLIARAVFAQLVARGGQDPEAKIASVYRKMVDIYRCCHAFEKLCAVQPALDITELSPGWSCMVGISYYNCVDVDGVKHGG